MTSDHPLYPKYGFFKLLMERKKHIDTHGDESCFANFPESRSLGVFMNALLQWQIYDFKQGKFYQLSFKTFNILSR